MRKIAFIISIALHVLVFLWITNYKFPLKTSTALSKKKSIDVVLVAPSINRFILSPPSSKLANPQPAEPKSVSKTASSATSDRKNQSDEKISNSTDKEATPGSNNSNNDKLKNTGERTAEPSQPLVISPTASPSNSTSSFSLYSKNLQSIIKKIGLPGKGHGFRGGSGSGNGDGQNGQASIMYHVDDFDLKPWAKRALFGVQKNWNIPIVSPKEPVCPVEISVSIDRSGKVSNIKIKQSSSVELLDKIAITAISMSMPLPPLPDEFPDDKLEAAFSFNYRWK